MGSCRKTNVLTPRSTYLSKLLYMASVLLHLVISQLLFFFVHPEKKIFSEISQN